MRKIYSTVLHNPPHSYGDCFRACLASVLETQVPHVLHDNCDAFQQRKRIDQWLKPRGLAFIEFPVTAQTPPEALKIANVLTQWTGIHYLLSGETRKGTGHYVVCRKNKIVHNPTPAIKIVGPFAADVFWMGIIADRL